MTKGCHQVYGDVLTLCISSSSLSSSRMTAEERGSHRQPITARQDGSKLNLPASEPVNTPFTPCLMAEMLGFAGGGDPGDLMLGGRRGVGPRAAAGPPRAVVPTVGIHLALLDGRSCHEGHNEQPPPHPPAFRPPGGSAGVASKDPLAQLPESRLNTIPLCTARCQPFPLEASLLHVNPIFLGLVPLFGEASHQTSLLPKFKPASGVAWRCPAVGPLVVPRTQRPFQSAT